VTTALFSWLALAAQALWLGTLIIDVVVLGPARRAVEVSERRLALAATHRLSRLARGALVIALWALVAEVLSLALQGTGDDWARAVAPETLGGMLASQNGHLVLLRFATLLVALLFAIRTHAPLSTADPVPSHVVPRRILRSRAAELASRWVSRRNGHIALAALSLLLVAFSGHAADVQPSWLSYPIDWLHLLSTAAWTGGIAALAYGVLPLRLILPPEERAPTILLLLDRFSPIAYGAVIVLTLAGLYNVVNHLGPPSRLVTTLYGQLLALKLGTVGTATFTLRLWDRRAPITMAIGAAIIHLYPVAQPSARAHLAPSG
jgi:copper transport protein